MPKSNARAMPDGDSVIFWIIRGLGGAVSMMEALTDNDVVLTLDSSRELFAFVRKLEQLGFQLSEATPIEQHNAARSLAYDTQRQ